ncbi:hypothetical protein ABVK25_006732 [Lepraria finkii]|uniref:Uncharacterized protein n=1 Tax=Lepraria finkii TaxID=1340010 RepID=A0ABR4B5Q0_9LECA
MPVQAIRTTSTARNGVGAFILQCKRLDFHYCDHWGSSKGMKTFLRSPPSSPASQPPTPKSKSTSPPPKHTPYNPRSLHKRPRKSNLCPQSRKRANNTEG